MPTIISSKMRSKQPAAPTKSAASEISSDEQLQLELAKQETAYAKAAAAKEKQLLKQEAAQQRQAAAKEKRQLKLEAAAAKQEARELARVQQEEEAAVAAAVEVAFERDENAKQREQLLAAHKEREGAERERVKGEKAMETAFRKGVAEIDKQNSPPKPRMRGGPAVSALCFCAAASPAAADPPPSIRAAHAVAHEVDAAARSIDQGAALR